MQHIDAEQLEEEKRKLKEKDKPKGIGGVPSRIPRAALTNVRVVQPNLVYAVGISMEICHEDTLKDIEFFGQFGKTVKISVNRSNQYASAMARHGPTGSAYVTFKRAEDALRCIKMIDGNLWRGKPVKACFGTTKYCNAFLKGVPCNNPDCLYLHELADDADCLTKEEVAAGLLPARFLAMGATNTFKPRLTINLIPNAQTAAAQAAAAAAAAAGQTPAAIQAAAAAAGGISRQVPPPPGSGSGAPGPPPYQHYSQQQQQQQQPPPPPMGSAPRVLTIPASGMRTASHGSLQHQDSGRNSSDYGGGGGGGYNGGGYGGGGNGNYNEMDSPGRGGYSGGYQQQHHHQHRHHHNELDHQEQQQHAGPSPPRGLWASAAAAGANAPTPSANAVPPPPPSDKQEWPTLAAAPSNASTTTTSNITTAGGGDGEAISGGGGLNRMPSMAEQLARAHSNPAEAKAARQPKKLLPLSSPGKTLKTLGKAIQRPASPLDAPIHHRPSGGLGGVAGVGAIGQGIVELNLGSTGGGNGGSSGALGGGGLLLGSGGSNSNELLSTMPQQPPGGAPRGPPPGFGSGGGLASHPLQSSGGGMAGPPGFQGGAEGAGAGGVSSHSSFDSLGNLHHQQLGGGGGVANGNGPSAYSPFVGGSALFDPSVALGSGSGGGLGSGGGSGSGSGVQRQRSRFAFANAEEEAANHEQQRQQHAMHAMGNTHLSSSGNMMMPTQQQAQQHQSQHGASSLLHQQHQMHQHQPHHGSPSPQDASAFFKSLFPTANINIANTSPPPSTSSHEFSGQHRMAAPPGFSAGVSPGMGNVQQQQHAYNPVSSMFPASAAAAAAAAGAGGEQGVAPGLALLRQLQGNSVSPHGSTGGAQQPPPGFGMRM
jgi:hypothetical protein